MERRVPMGVGRFGAVPALIAFIFAGTPAALGRDVTSYVSTIGLSSQQQNGTSTSRHRKSGSTHHTTLAEADDPSPELTKAESLIQKQDFAGAEPLLRKLVERDADDYVAWFGLGFVENGLGKTDESIAAYRKS